MLLMRRMEIPVIAEVRGIAAAAGCQLVASCDIVVAADNSKFMVPGQKVGLFCSTPGIALARAIPHKVALEMLFTGEPIDAQTALQCGLVSRVVPEKEVKFEALRIAELIGQHSRSVTALGKAFFYAQSELGVKEAYRYGGKVMVENLKLKDAQEGITAFTEKRKALFCHKDDKSPDCGNCSCSSPAMELFSDIATSQKSILVVASIPRGTQRDNYAQNIALN
ncbi:hypothetical protein V3C99_015377 [Haemonchus contortus]